MKVEEEKTRKNSAKNQNEMGYQETPVVQPSSKPAQNNPYREAPKVQTKPAPKSCLLYTSLATIDPQKPKPIPERQLINWEYDMLKKDTALQLNYGKTILPKQRARTYRHLMERAAKTSE